MTLIRVCLILLAVLSNTVFALSKVTVVGQQSFEDASHNYYIELLELALKAQGDNYQVEVVPDKQLTHSRTFQLLSNKFIDVYWAGTSKYRENNFKAIRMPVFKGLLGYRISIVKQDTLSHFSKLTDEQLKQKVACQGEHWPDTDILRYNGYQVMPVARFELMFKMVNKGHCDYFPRALFEGYGELAAARKIMPDLALVEDTVIHYPFPVYYFVNSDNQELASAIERGLLHLIKTQQFDKFMQEHPLTQHLFPLEKWQDKRFIRLKNPLLPKGTDITDDRFWIQL